MRVSDLNHGVYYYRVLGSLHARLELYDLSCFSRARDTSQPRFTKNKINVSTPAGCLEWIDVSTDQSNFPDGFWSVVLKDVKLGSESVLRSEATAVIDSGASLIIGPNKDIGELAGKLGAYCVKFIGMEASEAEPVSSLSYQRVFKPRLYYFVWRRFLLVLFHPSIGSVGDGVLPTASRCGILLVYLLP